MTIDALKFYQLYINEMIDMGGPNLAKSVSTLLGARLGEIYKKKGISGIENSLKMIYQSLNAEPTIKKVDDYKYEVSMEYPENFCPIGGGFHPDRTKLIQDCICQPYTCGFLNEIDPRFKYHTTSEKCILSDEGGTCHYMLYLEKGEKSL